MKQKGNGSTIEDNDSSKAISEASIQIEQNKEGLFSVKK